MTRQRSMWRIVNALRNVLFTKKNIYTLCFILFMIIDWTRGSQVGSTWAWTVNMTGVVLSVIMLSTYNIRVFLKPIYIVYSLACIIALPISYIWWYANQALIYRDKLLSAVLNVWFLGIILIKMFQDIIIYKTKKLSFCKIEIVIAFLLIWMFFSINEDVWPIWFLVMFGLFYHTDYSEETLEDLKQGLLNGIIIGFFLLQGAAFAFRPFDDGQYRYCGIYANCNINALFYCVVAIAFLLKLYYARKNNEKKWLILFYYVFVGIMFVLICFTVSKTALLSIFSVAVVYLLFADIILLEKKAKNIVLSSLLMMFVVCVSLPIVYGAVRYIPTILHHPIWYEGEYSEDKVHSFDPWDSEKYVSFDELTGGISERIKPLLNSLFGELMNGMGNVHASEVIDDLTIQKEPDETLFDNQAVIGRLGVWHYYLKNGTIVGHSSEDGHDIGWGDWYVWHAQNVFVQFWYYYGIPSAIMLLVIIVWQACSCIKNIFENNDRALICLLYGVLFTMYGLFECVWYPGQMILLLFFLTPIFLKKRVKM